MKRRVLSVFLALCMMASVMSAMTVTASAAAQSFTINGVTVSASSGKSVYNCSNYASEILKLIWKNFKTYNGKATTKTFVTTTFNSEFNMLKGKSSSDRKITEAHVKTYIQNAPLGSRIRVCKDSGTTANNYDNNSQGHTMVLVAKDNKAGTFTVLHSGWGKAEAKTYTYKNFTSYYANQKNYNYFFYIADLTRFTSVAQPLTISLTSYPTSIKKGSCYGLRGTVSSNYKITKVQGSVINSSGKTVLSSTDTPNSTSMNIQSSNLNNKLTFNKLAVGTYTMKVVATDASGKSVTWSKTFKVTK